jgi:superfamily II DNA helicase RecQ
MQLRIFVIPIKNVEPAEAELNRFLRGNRILAVTKEFVNHGENSFWSIAIEYLEPVGSMGSGQQSRKGDRIDYREVLSDEQFKVFVQLRELRKEIANKEAVPVYAVFTNEQLAEMARRRPTSMAGLAEIEGIGEAKTQKYGQSFLDRIAMILHDEKSAENKQ